MIDDWIRRTAFWQIDRLKGNKVKKHYNNIEDIMTNSITMEDRVQEIIEYAKKNVPFYENIQAEKIRDMPVMNKSIYRKYEDSIRSKEFLNDGALHWVKTSGSTGVPFKAPQDPNKRNRVKAELIYFHDLSGWRLGDRYAFIRVWVSHKASLIKRLMNNFIPFEATDFDSESRSEILKTIKNDKKLRIIFGYSSVITDLAEYILANGLDVPNKNIKLVVVDSDAMLEGAKEKISKAFGCLVMNRYDNEEQGVLACMKPGDDFWTVNTASYYIELLKIDSNEPCAPNEIGRVVVTDLTNHAMPFIRYDVGDLAVASNYNGKYATRIDRLEGRVSDVIQDTAGNRVYNIPLGARLKLFMEIQKYQVIQEGKRNYRIKIEVKQGEKLDDFAVINKLKECLGQDANIVIERVEKIETTKAGKYRPVINQYSL